MIPSTLVSGSSIDFCWLSGAGVGGVDDSAGGFESGAKVTFLDGVSTFISISFGGGAFDRKVGNGLGN